MTALRCLLTVAFAVPGGYCLLRCVRPGHAPGRQRRHQLVSAVAESAMSITMIAMLWAMRLDDPGGVLPAIFLVATMWYVTHAVAGTDDRARIELLHKGAAMAATFWMLLPTTHDTTGAAGAMPGMAMPAISNGPGRWVSVGFAGYLAFAALWWLHAGLGNAASPGPTLPAAGTAHPPAAVLFGPVGDAGSQTLMAAAMSAALLVPM